jgi:hypothetical protein
MSARSSGRLRVEDPGAVAALLAREKARAVAAVRPGRLVLGADQTLALGARRFSKPADRMAAREQLRALCGRTHELHSAVALVQSAAVIFAHRELAHLTMREFSDNFVASRVPKLAVILKPRTLLRFHEALKRRKYRWLFSSGGHRRPGPKGPSKELVDAIVELKRRNPRIGCPRIAQQIARAFGIEIDKDIVRRVLAKHYRPEAGTDGCRFRKLHP